MSNPVVAIGEPPFRNQDLIEQLEAFAQLYAQRPIKTNAGGMRSGPMFYTWMLLQWLQPTVIVESGVFQGQGTWLFEQVCPEAELHCIDPDLSRLQYRSGKARYYTQDFSMLDWSGLPRSETLLFFDDHQNAYERLMLAHWFGFEHVVFEDNYAAPYSDMYSLKIVLDNAGFTPIDYVVPWPKRLAMAVKLLVLGKRPPMPRGYGVIRRNTRDAAYVRDHVDVYYEFPPIFKSPYTIWGHRWTDEDYPTKPPLLTAVEEPYQQVFFDDAAAYVWYCYAHLKQG